MIDLSPAIRAVAVDPRILDLLGEFYGEAACLFKDKLIFKPPGAMGYGLHQDYIAWPGFPRSFLTVLLPLDVTNAENGGTEVFTGLHRQGALSPEDGEYHELSEDVVRSASSVLLDLEPGDMAVFGASRASLGPQPLAGLATPILLELQRGLRRGRPTDGPLPRVSPVPPPQICRVRTDRHLFSLTQVGDS